MSAMALSGLGVFGDDVYSSTDLNRRAGEVLNQARLRPVTISRNNEQFALLRREQAAKLIQTVKRLGSVIELLSAANAAVQGNPLSGSLSWLSVFEKDDLQKLVGEVSSAASVALNGGDFSNVETIIHEWRESALIAQSGVLDQAMFDEDADEVELPNPVEVVNSERETGD